MAGEWWHGILLNLLQVLLLCSYCGPSLRPKLKALVNQTSSIRMVSHDFGISQSKEYNYFSALLSHEREVCSVFHILEYNYSGV